MERCGPAGAGVGAGAKSYSWSQPRPPASASQVAIAFTVIVIVFALANRSVGQESPKPPTQENPQPSGHQNPPPPAQKETSIAAEVSNTTVKPAVELYTLLEKKSIVFPDIAFSAKPLAAKQKFQLFVDDSVSVNAVTFALLGSAIGQASGSPTGFGEGGSAYAKRFGSSLARHASSEFFGTFALASALHEDPRFFPERRPSLTGSAKYSLRRLFITRNDAGQDVVNVSGLLGPALAEGLANLYWPERNRTVGDTFFRYGVDLTARAAGNMIRDYWPVIRRKVISPAPQRSEQR